MRKSFDRKLIELLETDPRLVDQNGRLIKRSVIDKAWRTDHRLIRLLLSDSKIKAKFFDTVDNVTVFNTSTLVEYISARKFLGDSYTRFRNKLGLNIDKKFLRERGEVSLVWPYKDCVLEGGQSKEEEMRQEIFFNEILAHDEINQLFDPKVLTCWKRHTAKSEKLVSSIKRDKLGKIRENLIIKGNNLLALHTLKHQFYGQVKLIYIDPPYNTGGDSFKYNDNFKHSSWLTFMKNRLDVARDLLRKDGAIFVQCDDNEQAYLKVLMDEVFGKENFLSTISYQRSGVAGLGQGGKFVVNVTEYINIFSKDFKLFQAFNLENQEPFTIKQMKRYNGILHKKGENKLFHTFISKSTGEPVKIYKHTNFSIDKISLAGFEQNKKKVFKKYLECFEYIFRLNIPQSENSFQHHIISSFDDEGLYSVEYKASRGKHKGKIITNYYYKKQLFAWLKNAAKTDGEKIVKTNKLSDFWTNEEIPKADLANEGKVTLGRGKKPEQLLKRIIEMSTEPGDIVLDYHLGSGTTAAVAHKMNRQYIGIEQLDYGKNDSTVRLNNVIKGDSSGISKALGWKGGGEFVSCELMKYNEAYIDKIQAAKSSKELLALWRDISKNSFLKWYVNPKVPEEALKDFIKIGKEDAMSYLQKKQGKDDLKIKGSADGSEGVGEKSATNTGKLKKREWKNQKYIEKTFGTVLRESKNGLDRQKRLLLLLLNKNQLYVQLSEIKDKRFKVSAEDKQLNKLFFKEKEDLI